MNATMLEEDAIIPEAVPQTQPQPQVSKPERLGGIAQPKPRLLIIDSEMSELERYGKEFTQQGFEPVYLWANEKANVDTHGIDPHTIDGAAVHYFNGRVGLRAMLRELDFDAIVTERYLNGCAKASDEKFDAQAFAVGQEMEFTSTKPHTPVIVHATEYNTPHFERLSQDVMQRRRGEISGFMPKDPLGENRYSQQVGKLIFDQLETRAQGAGIGNSND